MSEELEEKNVSEYELDTFVDKASEEEIARKKSRKKKVAMVFGIIFGVLAAAYLGIAVFFMYHFGTNTYVDGVNVSFAKADAVKAIIDDYIDAYELTLVTRTDSHVIDAEAIDLVITATVDEEMLIKEQNCFLWPMFIGDDKKNYFTEYSISYSDDKLASYVASLDCTQAENMEAPEDAYIYVKKGEVVVCEETAGTTINQDILVEQIKTALDTFASEVNVAEDDKCYVVAEVTADSDAIVAYVEAFEPYKEMVITFELDKISWTLDVSTFGDWMFCGNGKWYFDSTCVKEYVESIAAKYNTVGTERKFVTTAGKIITQKGTYYGWKISVDDETTTLKRLLKLGESATHTPECSQTGAAYTYLNDIGSTYVECDLGNQKVYLYVDGELMLETNCVSGCVKKGYTTPEGLFGITYKQSPAVLRGDDYESDVTYWMPFNGGIGLHDATWRSKFGGEIYLKSGSHGCVNLPLSAAETIYNYVSKGTPVICYY